MLEKMKKVIERADDRTSKLSFVNYGLDDRDLVVLRDLLNQKSHITEIDLSHNNLTEDSGKILSEIVSLTRITLAQNSLGDLGAKALFSKKNLKFLDLTDNRLTIKIVDSLFERREQGVQIITIGNPNLNPEPTNEMLHQSSVHFRTEKKSPGPNNKPLKRSLEKYGKQEKLVETSSKEEQVLKSIKELIQELPEDQARAFSQEVDRVVTESISQKQVKGY